MTAAAVSAKISIRSNHRPVKSIVWRVKRSAAISLPKRPCIGRGGEGRGFGQYAVFAWALIRAECWARTGLRGFGFEPPPMYVFGNQEGRVTTDHHQMLRAWRGVPVPIKYSIRCNRGSVKIWRLSESGIFRRVGTGRPGKTNFRASIIGLRTLLGVRIHRCRSIPPTVIMQRRDSSDDATRRVRACLRLARHREFEWDVIPVNLFPVLDASATRGSRPGTLLEPAADDSRSARSHGRGIPA